jgi:hypothetical protein
MKRALRSKKVVQPAVRQIFAKILRSRAAQPASRRRHQKAYLPASIQARASCPYQAIAHDPNLAADPP